MLNSPRSRAGFAVSLNTTATNTVATDLDTGAAVAPKDVVVAVIVATGVATGVAAVVGVGAVVVGLGRGAIKYH